MAESAAAAGRSEPASSSSGGLGVGGGGGGGEGEAVSGGSGGDEDDVGGVPEEASEAADLTIRCGDIIAFYHCDEQLHLSASLSLEVDSPQDDVIFGSSVADRASPNALWQVQPPRGLHLADGVRSARGYCLQHLASGGYLAVTRAAETRYAAAAAAARAATEGKAAQAMDGEVNGGGGAVGEAAVVDERQAKATAATTVGAAQASAAAPPAKSGQRTLFSRMRLGGKSAADGASDLRSTSAEKDDDLSTVIRTENIVLCVRPLTDPADEPDLFELHDCHGASGALRASSLVRLRHVRSGGWCTAVSVHVETLQKSIGGGEEWAPANGSTRGGGEAKRGGGTKIVMAAVGVDCGVRDGLVIERPVPVTQTFLAVAGAARELLTYAREIESDIHGIQVWGCIHRQKAPPCHP